jgi:hypothetical protein
MDNCGGVVSCGTCAAGATCDTTGQCVSAVQTTLGVLNAISPSCGSCAQANGCLDPAQLGGTCEGTTGAATLFAGALPDGKTCSQVVPSATEADVCFQTLSGVFSSKCAATLQETPCLCGSTDVVTCLGGSATPTGAVYDVYACDFGTTSSTAIQSVFTAQNFGAGQANALIQCVASFGCSCF